MKEEKRNRIKKEAEMIINTKLTLRSLAKVMYLSKSTIHNDLTRDLKRIDNVLYKMVQKILLEHKKTRHLIGGNRTKEKYKNRNRKANMVE